MNGLLRSLHSLKCRVVQLILMSPGCSCSHPLIGPKCTESVSHEGEQLLVLPQTLAAGEDGARVHLKVDKHHRK